MEILESFSAKETFEYGKKMGETAEAGEASVYCDERDFFRRN